MPSKYFIGVDIGGTKILAGLVEPHGRILIKNKTPTPRHAPASVLFATLLQLLKDILAKQNLNPAAIRGMGIGVPGIIDLKQNIVITPNIHFSGFPLAEKLRKIFPARIVLGNDVNLGLLGEKWLGSGHHAENIIGLFPGTGVGGALILNNRLFMGSQGAAAELGHMILDMNSPLESHGLQGSLEALASRRAVEAEIRTQVKQGKKTILTKLNGGNLKVIKSGVIQEALARKDPLVRDVLKKISEVLGVACLSLTHILNPQLIILGGGLIEACGEFILPYIRKKLDQDPLFQGLKPPQLKIAQLGDDAILLGAVALAQFGYDVPSQSLKDYYPHLKANGSQGIRIDHTVYREDVMIRADGKVKKIDMEISSPKSRHGSPLGASALKRLCKKNPEILIVGSHHRQKSITREGQKFLKSKTIDCTVLPLPQAIDFYNHLDQRKALALFQA